jgi:hypothetical protein
LLTAADADVAEVHFRWVRREYVQDASDLRKFVGRIKFGLRPVWREYISIKFGPWDVDRFAGDHSTTAKRFNSLFDSRHAEAVDTMAQDKSKGVPFIFLGFYITDRILDKTELDNADVVLVVPEWPHMPWWRRLAPGAWRARVATSEFLPAITITPYNEH